MVVNSKTVGVGVGFWIVRRGRLVGGEVDSESRCWFLISGRELGALI